MDTLAEMGNRLGGVPAKPEAKDVEGSWVTPAMHKTFHLPPSFLNGAQAENELDKVIF